MNNRLMFAVVGALAVGQLAVMAGAAETKKTSSPDLQRVLDAEATGSLHDRGAALAKVISQSPDLEAARWQAGFVKTENGWSPFGYLPDDREFQAKFAEYVARRAAAEQSLAAQIKLADWCKANNLPDQERATLTYILEQAPENLAVRNRLGWRRVGDRWFNKYELDDAREEFEANRKAYGTWAPQIKRLVASLKHPDVKLRTEAEKKLKSLQTPEMLGALETFASEADDTAKRTLVDIVDDIRGPRASLLLAKFALGDAFGAIGQAAEKSLRRRPADEYVPSLLAQLSSPIEARMSLYAPARNRLVLHQVFFREFEDFKQQLTVTNTVRGGGTAAASRLLNQQAADQQRRLQAENEKIQDMNQAIFAVLEDTTGRQLPHDARSWWQWWYDENEVLLAFEKPTFQTQEATSLTLVDPLVTGPSGSRRGSSGSRKCECLVAGTPIWTHAGLLAVEKIQAGDLVLAQDVETGELGYKPVLKPTVRPPGPTIRVQTAQDTIRASGGHLFWIAGRGWLRARQLEPGMRLHTVTGTMEIQEVVDEGGSVPTYNLIVADFHTYFVGQGKVLSHDNSIKEPTAATVPGYTPAAPTR